MALQVSGAAALTRLRVARLFRQIRKQVAKATETHAQPMVFAAGAEQHLRHR
jgi:hypothetical protein